MDLRIPSIGRFLYSHYFFGGVRQGVGMLLPVLLVGGLGGHFAMGLVATFGAQCVAIIDQPGGPRRHRANEMLSGALVGTASVLITGLASTHPLLLWLVVILQCFVLSMFTVFGKRGGLIGFAGLLLMTLTMHTPMAPDQALEHALASLGGSVFYILFSMAFSHVLRLREERQALSVALFATADYMAARANFYDQNHDLDDTYNQLIQRQSVMTEQHQAARDMVLRELTRRGGTRDAERVMLWNMFMDMLQLLDTLVATQTDYALLRRVLAGHDALIFMRDAMVKMTLELNRIALDVSRARPTQYRSSAKAELRAIEYEIEQIRQQDLGRENPEAVAIMVQVLRRLRNASRIVDRLAAHSQAPADAQPMDLARIDKSLTRFMSREQIHFSRFTSNLRLNSPNCRYALRVALAAALAMAVAGSWELSSLSVHSYWVLLTIVIIMKPGFALTRQRNGWRLIGTLIGCLLALGLFAVTMRPSVLFAALLVACIMGNSLVLLNYMGSAIFNTLYVVLVFHFVAPGSVSLDVIGERALDTALGCALALLCSYVLPWWEVRYMKPLARNAARANREYLQAGLAFIRATREQARPDLPESEGAAAAAALTDADIALRLARKNVHIAFSNFADAFYRMMSEPRSHQLNIPEYNNLLIQNHVLASQITASVPLLAALAATPEPMQRALEGMLDLLDEDRPAPQALPSQFDTEGELASLAYPMKQMLRACTMIRGELAGLAEPEELTGGRLRAAG